MILRKCIECGKSFIVEDLRQKCCSDECRIHRKKAIAKEYYKKHIKPQKEAICKKCKTCGKQFVSFSNGQKYCSEECRRAYYKQPLGKRTFECAFCGNSFEADARRKYCSAECRIKSEASAKKRSKRKKPKLSLNQVAKFCREEGLSYGRYVAKYGL